MTKKANSKQRFSIEYIASVDQNAKSMLLVVLVIEISNFEFIYNLMLVFWDFSVKFIVIFLYEPIVGSHLIFVSNSFA